MIPFIYLLVFIKVLRVSCEGNSSITFVIDDTRSMKYDISQVKKEVGSIMDIMLNEKSSQIKDIVLVTFNDPDVQLRCKTNSREEIMAALRKVKTGNYDNINCPEASMAGVRVGLESSSPKSYLYVFTDAIAKDYGEVDTIKRLCQQSQSQVTFILTGDCRKPQSPGFKVYHQIATASGGQVYRIDKDEVDQVIQTIKEMVKGKKSVYLSQIVPPSNGYTEMPFTIDDKTEYAMVSVSGKNVMVKLRGPSLRTKKIMWTKNGKVVKLIDPVPGDYVAKVKGSDFTNVVIYGRTDFVFTPGFSELFPKYFDETANQPVAGTENHLSILVDDPDHEVLIEYAQILNLDGRVIKKLPLFKKDGDFYYTRDLFVSPSTLFNVAVHGIVEKTGKPIKRISSPPVEPQIEPEEIEDYIPEVTINEGDRINSSYGSELVLTCDVAGYPRPSIVWKDSSNLEKKSESSMLVVPDVFVSHLTLSSVKNNETYYCEASNIMGTVRASISVEVPLPFNVNTYPSGTINIKYGQDKTLECDITSISSMQIAWYLFKDTKKITIEPSNNYVLSDGNKKLTIKSMSTDLDGKYMCKAWLADDERTNVQYSVLVNTDGLTRPALDTSVKVVEVKENYTAEINCRVVSGVPPPTITWYYKSPSSEIYQNLEFDNIIVGDTSLRIDDAELCNSGSYKCKAENSAGDADHITELIVKSKPIVKIDEGPELSLYYGTVTKVSCTVTGNPKPKIVWKDSNGKVIVDSTEQKTTGNDFEYVLDMIAGTGSGLEMYYCYAENDQGIGYDEINIEVISPLQSGEPGEIVLEYGKPGTLVCNVTANYPLLIKWYKFNEETNQNERISDTDKFTVLNAQSSLVIHSMDVDLIGQYTCEAQILFDDRQKAEYKINVTISDLGIPIIDPLPEKVEVKERDVAIIPCKLLKAVPPPEMTWEFMKLGASTYIQISGFSQYLRISSANMEDLGRYRCVAKNSFGKAEKFTDLIVNKPPIATIVEGTKINLKHGDMLSLTCRVNAYPEPKITWKDDNNLTLPEKGNIADVGFMYTSILEVPNITEPSRYSCIAENSNGVANVEVDVSVNPIWKNGSTMPEITNIEYGKRGVILCDAESDESFKIKWYRLNDITGRKEPLEVSDVLTLSENAKKLEIKFMDFDLEGEYFCEATLESDMNQKKELKTEVKLTGLATPEIDKTIKTLEAVENSSVTINCIILKGTPKPTISWQWKTSDSTEFRPRNESGETIKINSVSIADLATYKCIASNVLGVDNHEIQLTVKSQPIILVENNTLLYKAVVGDDSLRIPCNAIGNPTPVITWQKDNEDISPDDKYFIDKGALIINDPNESDSGEFTCEAKNDIGVDSVTFEASISPYLDDLGNINPVYVRVGENKTIECKLPYTDPKAVRWYFDEEYMNKTGPNIYIVDANTKMDGNYSCRVSNMNSSPVETYVLDVGYPPEFTDDTENIQWTGGNDEIINCDAKAKPYATAKWLLNGEPVKVNDPLILQLPITNIGIYTCEVSNAHGSIQRDIAVNASVCVINRKLHTKPNSPLMLVRSYSHFEWPEYEFSDAVVIIEPEDTVTFVCPNSDGIINNFQKFPDKSELDVICDHEDVFLLDDISYKLSHFTCKETVKPVVKKTGTSCMKNNTEILHVGFNASTFIDVYEVCHDSINIMPLFTRSTMLNMNNIGASIDQDWFIYKEYNKGNEAYTCYEGVTTCCYAKQQFVNALDVGYGSPQISTYMDYINSVPIWRPCPTSRRVSWDQVEKAIRDQLTLRSIILWSGGSQFEEILTDGLVPRYLWKIVLLDESDLVAVVYVNDPHPEISDIRCKNICAQHKLLKMPCDDRYTYVCEFEDFLEGFELTGENFGISNE